MDKQLVMVVWEDAWADQENFTTAHGIIATHEPMTVRTIGWLIVDNEVGVSIANEQSLQEGQEVFRGRTFILRSMVKQVVPYNLTKPRAKKVDSSKE